MSTINDGGFAFPMPDVLHVNGMVQHGFNGMTLREYYAGQALAGLASYVTKGATFDDIAKDAYAIADAMLKAREVKP
jgi:hypothetical protein